jgi:hypothetical protein
MSPSVMFKFCLTCPLRCPVFYPIRCSLYHSTVHIHQDFDVDVKTGGGSKSQDKKYCWMATRGHFLPRSVVCFHPCCLVLPQPGIVLRSLPSPRCFLVMRGVWRRV